MTTTTYSPKTRFMSLYRGMLRRNMGSGIYLTLALIFFYPLQYLMELINQADRIASGKMFLPTASYVSNLLGPAHNYTAVSLTAVCFLLLAAPAVLMVAQNSYMHSRQASDLYHSLPLTRSQLMCASTATVFTIVGIPVVFCQVLVLIIGEAYALSGAIPQLVVSPVAILQDLLVWLIAIAAIITVMMLVSVLVGSAFENFILGLELLVAGPLLLAMCSVLFQSYLVGYTYDISAAEASFFSPVTFVLSWYQLLGEFHLLWPCLFWLVMVIVLFVFTLWLYSRRKSELAETTGVQGILGFLTKAIAVCIGSAVIGGILAAVSRNSNRDFNFVIGVLAGAALTIFLLEGVFGRGFQGIKQILPEAGVLTTGATALAIMLVSGGLGYETRIPALDTIQDATINFRGRYGYVTEYVPLSASLGNGGTRPHMATSQSVTLATDQAVELVREYHQALISTYVYGIGASETGRTIFPDNLSYRLHYGHLKRDYDYRSGGAQLAPILLNLEQTPEFREVSNPVLRITGDALRGFWVEDRYGLSRSVAQENPDKINSLLSTLQTDMREEDYRRYNSGQARIQGYLYFDTGLYGWDEEMMTGKSIFQSFYIPVLDSYRRTILFLQESGLGAYLLEPDSDEIAAIGISDYDVTRTMDVGTMYGQAGRAESQFGVNDKELSGIPRSFDLVVRDQAVIRSLLAKAESYRVGEVKNSLYLTVIGPQQEGLTLWLAPEYLPADLRRQVEERLGQSQEAEGDPAVAPDASEAVGG